MLLDEAKKACRVLSNDYDSEINRLIRAALADIDITDVDSALLDIDARAYLLATEDSKALYGEESTATTVTEDGLTTLLPLIKQAVITYCKIHYPYQLPEHVYRQLKESYDEQKAQMLMNSKYTTWKSDYA